MIEIIIKAIILSGLLCKHLTLALLGWLVPRLWYAKLVDQEVVLITGAGSGLGRDIALEYAKLKSSLVLWDINKAGLEETKNLVEAQYIKVLKEDEIRECLTYVVDVSDKDKIYDAAKQVKADLNRSERKEVSEERYVSVLVNNAGIYYGQYLQQLTDQQIEKIFNINILAHFWTVRTFLPDMIKHKRGHIVEIASMGGIVGMFKQVDYCATKFATVGFEQSLNMELDHLGLGDQVRTTVVCPFFFNSNLFSNFDTKAASLMSSKYVAKEAVLAMRCNQAQVSLPKVSSYPICFFRGMVPRGMNIDYAKVMLAEGVKDIVGHGSTVASQEVKTATSGRIVDGCSRQTDDASVVSTR